jgi:hypothetical protein
MSSIEDSIQVKYMFPNFKSDVYECPTQKNLTVIIIPNLSFNKLKAK